MPAFEYYRELIPRDFTNDEAISQLNVLGAQGWEVMFMGGTDAEGNRAFWLKREAVQPIDGGPPTVTSISPQYTNTGSQKISVRGTNFTPQSVIVFGGIAQTTTFQDEAWLQATVAMPVGVYDVLVREGGVDSNAMQFEFK